MTPKKTQPPKNQWDKDSVQFPRLLAEIHAMGLGVAEVSHLCREMDITQEQLEELFYRAEKQWEKIKSDLLPPRFKTSGNYRTPDGYTLTFDEKDGLWTDGDLEFKSVHGRPVDSNGDPLEGDFLE